VLELERLGTGGVEWRFESDTGEPVYVAARSDELREVVLNVLENARHAGARHVSVSLAPADSRVAVVIQDDGAGIAHDVLPRIFEPHFSTRTSGSGLGLAISRQLVEGWGGEITLSTREGEGTTVKIELRREAI
ncbi:MAG: ATP-binding protein, partial [Gemmatimonadaceae bacterium]